ncbi:hypothetical protein HDV00_010690, partial [Rhizophlyctis rosea]
MVMFAKKKDADTASQTSSNRTSTTSVDKDAELGDYQFYPDPLSRAHSVVIPPKDRSPGGSTVVSPTTPDAPLLKGQTQDPTPDQPQYSSYYARQAMEEAAQDRHKGPQALFNPQERLKKSVLKSHRPVFTMTLTAVQLGALIWSFVMNQQRTGEIIETKPTFNYLIGPAPG